MTESGLTAAIFFHPDAYDVSKKLMGRQSAGNGFLRAAVAGRGGEPVTGYGPTANVQADFVRLVRAIDPGAPTQWLRPDTDPAALSRQGVCFRADPVLGGDAQFRLRVGPTGYSITGLTHTLSSRVALESVRDLLREPLEPWDALICTSQAALDVVQNVHGLERDYLRWRFGSSIRIDGPQLPVIPLGVHTDDFTTDAGARAAARREFGIEDDEVVVLYVGRLLFHAKAHPYPMFRAAEAAAARTGRKIRLVFYGRAAHPETERAFRAGAERYAPSVRATFLDGREVESAKAWACADIFSSLADAVQETFGLTPVEAMASGLPCLVSDWNGYKDTVRDGVDGFRTPTWAPAEGAGLALARGYEAGGLEYDRVQWMLAASTVVDIRALTERLSDLVANPDLRRTMGESGRSRAREIYDWAVVYRQYQALWADLAARRAHAVADAGAPKVGSAGADPFFLFQRFPTRLIGPQTRVRAADGASLAMFEQLAADRLFSELSVDSGALGRLWSEIAAGETTVGAAAARVQLHLAVAMRGVGVLAKMGLVEPLAD